MTDRAKRGGVVAGVDGSIQATHVVADDVHVVPELTSGSMARTQALCCHHVRKLSSHPLFSLHALSSFTQRTFRSWSACASTRSPGSSATGRQRVRASWAGLEAVGTGRRALGASAALSV
jgi:hypothetical protein